MAKDVGYEKDKIELSEFNEAVRQVVRLGNIWENCHNYSRKGELIKYKWELDRAWIELGSDGRRLNSRYYVESIKTLNRKIADAKTKPELYRMLQKKEEFLRDLQEEAGKGGKKTQHWGRMM